MVDLSGRAKKSRRASSTGTDGSPSTARAGGAMRSQGLVDVPRGRPSVLSILGLKLTFYVRAMKASRM
jgi:hypothetical protein